MSDAIALMGKISYLSGTPLGYAEPLLITTSRVITVPFNCLATIRAISGGGGGAGGAFASGGNAGTYAWLETPLKKGDAITVTVGAGGAANSNGGATSLSGAVAASIPGGRGGVLGSGQQPAANADPTGWDGFVLGGRGGASATATRSGGGGAVGLFGEAYDGGAASTASTGGGGGVGGAGGFPGGGSGGPPFGASPGANLIGGTGEAQVSDLLSPFLVAACGSGGAIGAAGGSGSGGGSSGGGTGTGGAGGAFGGGGGSFQSSSAGGGGGGAGLGGGGASASGGAGGRGGVVFIFKQVA
ncbi:hypothetical protein [Ottowia sp.]|uniref:hypothetical protein n=1 Tax=Ottowia sp. TaxID=1898956 RepID=UPI003A85A0C2